MSCSSSSISVPRFWIFLYGTRFSFFAVKDRPAPRTGLCGSDNAKDALRVSGLALRTLIPLHTLGQKRCSWIPGRGVSGTESRDLTADGRSRAGLPC